MRKVPFILILCLFFTFLFPNAEPGGYGSYPPPNNWDWVITNDTLVENETIILNGNLTIETGGNLTFINVTLKMNCAENGSYHIEVMSGGAMYIINSNITSNITDREHRFNFIVRKDAKFEMKNSELHECGYYALLEEFETMGLYLETSYIQISDSLFSNNFIGIMLKNASFADIKNSIFKDNMNGLELRNANNNIISCNQFSKNVFGIKFFDAENTAFINNTISNNSVGIASFGSISNSILKNNTFSNNSINFGLNYRDPISDLNLDIDSSNIINGAPIFYLSNLKDLEISPETGYEKTGYLAVVNSENITINNISLHNNVQGLLLINSTNCRIENVRFIGNVRGLVFTDSSDNIINNCDFIKSDTGILLFTNSNNNTIQNCEINESGDNGIILFESSNNIMSYCNIFDGEEGIWIIGGKENVIRKCNIYQQHKFGINISSMGNMIYFNNFYSNNIHAIDNGYDNQWDDGKVGGNYWDDYTGLDNGSNNRIVNDGIGDTNLPHLGLDYYPFINKDGWLNYSPLDTDDDGIPDLIDPDIDDDGVPNEDDFYPYDETRWQYERRELNWVAVIGAVIFTVIVIIIIILIIFWNLRYKGR